MPPKKKEPAKKSLEGYAITLATNTIPKDVLGGTSLAALKASITNNGGSYTAKVEDSTHLVATEAQFEKGTKKVEDAKSTPVQIVSYEWLEKSLSSKTSIDEKTYTLHDPAVLPKSTSNGTKATDSKKRKRSKDEAEDEEEAPELKRSTGNGKAMNVTKKLDMKIPVDEELIPEYGRNFIVHIDNDSAIYDVTLNQSDSGANANKFYRLQLLKDNMGLWYTWTRWGRVGESGQKKMVIDGSSYDAALNEFHKKFKDKTGNTWADRATGPMKAKKYVFVEKSYEDSDSEGEDDLPGADKRTKKPKTEVEEDAEDEVVIESKLPEAVQQLMKLIFNQDNFNATFDAFDYDAKKMPLGKLSKSSLMRGYEVLKTLSSLVGGAPGDQTQIEQLSNNYLSLIPHVVPRSQRPPKLDHIDKIKKEIELLEALTDMQLANDLMKNAKKGKERAEEINLLDRQFEGLGMAEMTPVDKQTTEFEELEKYLVRSVGHTHGTRYKVQDIFRMERSGETDRFDKSDYAKIKNKNRRLLWHGSRTTNYGGILSQGLRIAPPEAPVSGYMFGKGVYLADMSSKSANYCASHSSGGTGLLLLCEAELGEPPLKLTNADYNAGERAKDQKLLSTWGVGRTAPQAWKDASVVHPSLKGINMPDVVTTKPGHTKEPGAYLEYNEYICYDVAQIKLRYLFRVQM